MVCSPIKFDINEFYHNEVVGCISQKILRESQNC